MSNDANTWLVITYLVCFILQGVVMRAVGENEDLETKKSIEDHDGIVTQYKDIIREQVNDCKVPKAKPYGSCL